MSRSVFIGLAALAGVTMTPMAMAQDGAITVYGPRVETADQSARGVHPPQALVTQVAVQTHDLDLRTQYGRNVLDHRVEHAARKVCARIDELHPSGGPAANPAKDSGDCRHEARKSAEAQVRAILRARG